MAVEISSCGHDERGLFSGGRAGDQDKTEYKVCEWYRHKYGWDCVLRHPDAAVAADIAKLARQAAENDAIGYDQGQRETFWKALKGAADYLPANIAEKCEADCSSSTGTVVKAVGYRLGDEKLKAVSVGNWTGSLREALVGAGFECLTKRRYRVRSDYLRAGDVLLNEEHHVVIVVSDGAKVKTGACAITKATWERSEPKLGGKYRVRKLEKASVVVVTEVSGGWAKVACGNWVLASRIKES